MQYLQQILFILTLAIAIWLFSGKVKEISSNIRLGKDEDFSDHPGDRWKNVLLLAFGQKKMFRKPLVALLHFVIYAGFLIINIEVLEIILDGPSFSSSIASSYRYPVVRLFLRCAPV